MFWNPYKSVKIRIEKVNGQKFGEIQKNFGSENSSFVEKTSIDEFRSTGEM